MDAVIAALGHPERLKIVVWLLRYGEARQIKILRALERSRGGPVNPGSVTMLLRPLLEAGVLERGSPRGPIAVRDPERTWQLLLAARAIAQQHADPAAEDGVIVARSPKPGLDPSPRRRTGRFDRSNGQLQPPQPWLVR